MDAPQSASTLTGLAALLVQTTGLPLHGDTRRQGLFPRTMAGKKDAAAALAAGWIEAVASTRRGKNRVELYQLTAAGQRYLQEQADPQRLLEQLNSEIARRQHDLLAARESLQRCEQQLRLVAERIADCLPKVTLSRVRMGTDEAHSRITATVRSTNVKPTDLPECFTQHLLTRLKLWTAEQPQADCPLPELYRSLARQAPEVTVGQFHDQVRRLQAEGALVLQPWTGPLFELPEPDLALLMGHAIMYYAAPAEELAAA